jgi:hypothetical protein
VGQVADSPADALRVAIGAAEAALAAGSTADRLGEHLYEAWYAAPVEDCPIPVDLPADLAAVLRAAHAGSEVWERGWVAEEVGPAAQVVARRGEERRTLERCEHVALARPGLSPSPGDDLLAPARRDSLDSHGWWCTHSPDWRLEAPAEALVRFYWNIGPGDVAALVRAVSARLIGAATPWMLKCAVDRRSYVRADAVVLYLPPEAVDELRDGLDRIAAALHDRLRAGAPPLTLPARRGLAVCDDPGTGESFGQHRSRLIAEGVLRARSRGAANDADTALEAVAERLREEGVPVERPYLAGPSRRLPWE